MPKITKPVMFDTPEADAILSALQVFPPDNAWNQDISALPVHPDSGAIIASIGADKPLGYNLDMGFVIVPPDQKRVAGEAARRTRTSPTRARSRCPTTRPSRTGRSQRNEDTKALPKAGADPRRHSSATARGDRHIILVDPVNGLPARVLAGDGAPTRAGRRRNAATFDLAHGRAAAGALDVVRRRRPADLPGRRALRRDARAGMVEHAMRFTVRQTRRGYVLPAHALGEQPARTRTCRAWASASVCASDFDVSGFPPHAQAILKGLKTYGMFVADNGSDWLMSIAPDRRLEGPGERCARVKGLGLRGGARRARDRSKVIARG